MARLRTRNVSNNGPKVLCYPQKGLPSLPIELLLLVMSHMKAPIIPWYQERAMWNEGRERRECLRALCQLCLSLRAALLPVLWERLEACRPASCAFLSQILEQEVVGQLNLMIDLTLPYASYVRVVNVAIEPRFSPTALLKLAHAMTLMPNLHTVQIMCKETMHQYCKTDRFQKAFTTRVYPSVRRASLPHQATSILASFPEVVEVYINQLVEKSKFYKFLQAVALHCRKVECFGWRVTWGVPMDIIPQKLPNLRRLECCLANTFNISKILDLAKLKNLEKFTLIIDDPSEVDVTESRAILVARKALAGSSSPNKCLIVYYGDQILVETFGAL